MSLLPKERISETNPDPTCISPDNKGLQTEESWLRAFLLGPELTRHTPMHFISLSMTLVIQLASLVLYAAVIHQVNPFALVGLMLIWCLRFVLARIYPALNVHDNAAEYYARQWSMIFIWMVNIVELAVVTLTGGILLGIEAFGLHVCLTASLLLALCSVKKTDRFRRVAESARSVRIFRHSYFMKKLNPISSLLGPPHSPIPLHLEIAPSQRMTNPPREDNPPSPLNPK